MVNGDHANECLNVRRANPVVRGVALALYHDGATVSIEALDVGREVAGPARPTYGSIPEVTEEIGHGLLELGRCESKQIFQVTNPTAALALEEPPQSRA